MSPRLRALLTRLQPAGVILFARNITSAEQTHKLLKECQSCVSTPLFACVDMEGGKVDRFRNVTGPAPSAADVFATGDPKLFRRHGKTIGESCRALGFNTDFAPVVDLAFEASRNVMSSRSVSADPKEVISYAREFLAGLRSTGVLGAIKHFPGLGEANLDTHHELPSVEKPWKKLPTAHCGANRRWSLWAMPLIRRSRTIGRQHLCRRNGLPTFCARRSATEGWWFRTISRWVAC
jgi:beta-N-acetylhexosaminidase